MKKMLLAVLMLATLLCSAAYAQSDVLNTAIENATFLIMEINSMGAGFESDGIFDDPATNTVAICIETEDYSFADFRDIKKNDSAAYQALMKEFLSLSNEFNAVCDVDLQEKVNVVFTVISNDGVGLYLTFNRLDLTWMICNY